MEISNMNEIFARHSVRHFKKQAVEKDKIELLLRAAMQSPSGCNQQPWEFVVADEPEILSELAGASEYTSPAGRAPLAIVTLGNIDFMRCPDLWTHDMGACCENILLEAVSLGLGAVWMSIDPVESRIENVRRILGLPGNIKPFSIIAVGYPDENIVPADRFKPERIHHNRYEPDVIDSFSGDYYFLSNFYPAEVLYDGIVYQNSEAAFQAQKCRNPKDRELFSKLGADEAKKLGRKCELRPDWESVKLNIMEEILFAKFTGNPSLAEKLMKTGVKPLLEGNTHHDTYWGVELETGKGENHLGKILESIRGKFAENGLNKTK